MPKKSRTRTRTKTKTKTSYFTPKKRSKKKSKPKKSQRGGAYGNTLNSMLGNAKAGMGFGHAGPIKYNHCGGSKLDNVIYNNRVGYGYTSGGSEIASDVQGSYAPISPYVTAQCGAGRKKKGKKYRKNKSRKSRKHMKKSKKSKKGKKRKTKKRRKKHHQKGGSGYSQYLNNTPVGTSFESPVVNPPLNALGPLSVNKTNINCTDNYNHYKK